VDEGEERPAGIITAAIEIDRRRCRPIAAVDRNRRVSGRGGVAGNVHVDGSVAADAALRVIDLSDQRIRSNVSCGHVDRSVSTDRSADVRDTNERATLRSEIARIASKSEGEVGAPDDVAAGGVKD